MNQDFLGVNNFSWWFGVVESRTDPLNLGRCKVRCFGWHTEDTTQITLDDLPWATPVVPFGVTNVHPPKEGTMVFGFFADGQEGRFPILMGTIPGIPEESREPQQGFSDPLTAAVRGASQTPRKPASSKVTLTAAGPVVTNKPAARFPDALNEPTTSKLARPDRVEGSDGSYLGIRTESIANTSIDFQRKNRLTNIKSAGSTYWQEPFPSYNAKYPFNNVTETESGHAVELDDTPGYERVQLSHRLGSTLEFLPSGSIKQKSFNHRYDITMGNQKVYVNGKKEETVQSDMLLRINGKLVIQCDGLDLISSKDINIKGQNVTITSLNDMNISALNDAKISCGNFMQCRGESGFSAFGGEKGAALASSTNAVVEGGLAAKLSGINASVAAVFFNVDAAVTNIFPPVMVPTNGPDSPTAASRIKLGDPKLTRTNPANAKENTDLFAYREQQKANVAGTFG